MESDVPECEQCGIPMHRTETHWAVVWSCEECGQYLDDDEESHVTRIRRNKRYIE